MFGRLFLKAERNSQWRFNPWIKPSVCTMVVEISPIKFVSFAPASSGCWSNPRDVARFCPNPRPAW